MGQCFNQSRKLHHSLMAYQVYSTMNIIMLCFFHAFGYYLFLFLSMQLKDYSLGHMESKTDLGYVKRGCGLSAFDTLFVPVGEMYSSPTQQVLHILSGVGYLYGWLLQSS